MSLSTVLSLVHHPNAASVYTMMWLMDQINYNKLLSRVRFAHNHPESTTKCVLLEYAYTNRNYVISGNPNIVEYLPETHVLVHHALNTPDFIRFMDSFFKNDNDKVTIYTRQKIKADGTPDFHKKQLVVMFEPWAFVTPPPPQEMETIE